MDDKEQKIVFSKNLNRLLSDAEKTQKEVADAIHVLPSTFNTWCQGVALPRMGKVQLLADYFGVKKSDLIEERAPGVAPDASEPREQELLRVYRRLDERGKRTVEMAAQAALLEVNAKSGIEEARSA